MQDCGGGGGTTIMEQPIIGSQGSVSTRLTQPSPSASPKAQAGARVRIATSVTTSSRKNDLSQDAHVCAPQIGSGRVMQRPVGRKSDTSVDG